MISIKYTGILGENPFTNMKIAAIIKLTPRGWKGIIVKGWRSCRKSY